MDKINLNNGRSYSLDVFRGATVCLMILVNNPGSWANIYSPLKHAAWHGITPTDLVFPFFLFAVGNAMAYTFPKLIAGGEFKFWKKVVSRFVLIFLIGIFLNWMPFVKYENDILVFKPWGEIRIMGVLQRIAVSYLLASVIIKFFKTRGAFVAGSVILLLYWFLCVFINPADPFSLSGWFGTAVDKQIFGESHMYFGEALNGNKIHFDPEGLASSAGAVVQVIFGYLCGDFIIKKGRNYEMLVSLFTTGIALLFTGYVWDMSFPINKKIWTSSYVVYTSGMAMIIIAVMIFQIDLKNNRPALLKFFNVFGKNALFIFFLSGFLPRLLNLIRIPESLSATGYITPFNWFYEKICKPVFPGDLKAGSLLYALLMIAFYWLIVYIMDKRKIYIKV